MRQLNNPTSSRSRSVRADRASRPPRQYAPARVETPGNCPCYCEDVALFFRG
jgi:hypothetical protein